VLYLLGASLAVPIDKAIDSRLKTSLCDYRVYNRAKLNAFMMKVTGG